MTAEHVATTLSDPLTWTTVSGAELRDLRVGSAIALDGLYFAVRDELWATIPGTLVSTRVDPNGIERRETTEWEHRSGTVNLQATLTLTTAPGRLSLEASTTAIGPQTVRRVGMCLLHPLELRGAAVDLHHDDGRTERGAFPADVSPHQPFLGLMGLTEHLAGGAALEIVFEGGVFETEDHRNWTDAGWKTYSPPLADPSPIRLRDGERLWQRVSLTAVPGGASIVRRSSEPAVVEVAIGGLTGDVLPRLGTGVSGLPLAATAPAGLSFLLCELQDDADGPVRFEMAVAEAQRNGLPLSILLSCSAARLDHWAAALRDRSADIERITVVDPDSRVTAAGAVRRLRALLDDTTIRIGAGTRGYGAELGRSTESFAGADHVQVTASAMVHHADDRRVMDTVRAYPDLVRLAHAKGGDAPLLLGPVTLRERLTLHAEPFGAYAPYSSDVPVDPRTSGPLGAAFVVGVISGAAGAESLSFFWNGPAGGLEHDGVASPAACVLETIGRRAGAPLREVTVSDPRSIAALAWSDGPGQSTVCVANLTAAPLAISVGGSLLRLDAYATVDVALDD